MENDNEDELRNLEMNEQSFQTLLGEWQRILDEKQQRKIELQEKESYVKEIIPVVDNLNERLKDKQNVSLTQRIFNLTYSYAGLSTLK